MPTLGSTVAVELHELLQDSSRTASTLRCKSGRVVKMAVNVIFVFIIAVLRPERDQTDRTSEVLNVVLLACTC